MNEHPPKFNEPSVLDYVKSKLSFGRRPEIEIPESHEVESKIESVAPQIIETKTVRPSIV